MARRDEALVVALDLLDEVGLAGITVRRLAARLDVQPGALYRHFTDKADLLAAMVERVLTDAGDVPVDGVVAPWDEQLRAVASGARAAMLARRDGALLVVTHLRASGPEGRRLWQRAIDSLGAGGLDPELAARGLGTVLAFTNGFTLEEQSRDGFAPEPSVRAWRDAGFREGLELIVAGLGSRGADRSPEG